MVPVVNKFLVPIFSYMIDGTYVTWLTTCFFFKLLIANLLKIILSV